MSIRYGGKIVSYAYGDMSKLPDGGGGFSIPLIVEVETGAKVTATNEDGETSVTAVSVDNSATLQLTKGGKWTAFAIKDGLQSTSIEVSIPINFEKQLVLPTPDNYDLVEYIGINSTFRLALKHLINSNSRIMLDMEIRDTTPSGWYYVMNTDDTSYNCNLYFNKAYGKSTFSANYRFGTMSSSVASGELSLLDKRFILDVNYPKKRIDVGSYYYKTFSTNNGKCTAQTFIGMGSTASVTTFKSWRIYSLKVYSNDNLLQDFVPCVEKGTNYPGLYDKINREFYDKTKLNSSSIIAGPTLTT